MIRFLFFLSCFLSVNATAQEAPQVKTLPLPKSDYTRFEAQEGSFSAFVQDLPVQKGQYVASVRGRIFCPDMLAKVNIPLLFPDRDLEQCADWAMRLWADYHRQKQRLSDLYLFNYGGEKQYFKAQQRSFASFLKWAFAYSNSYSLKQGTIPIREDELRPGDLLVQNETGGIGHVSVILDQCQNTEGATRYRVGFSFMPAQEMRILEAPARYGTDGWYTLDGIRAHLKADYFDIPVVLRRFE